MKIGEISARADGGKISSVLCGVGSIMDVLGTRHAIIKLEDIEPAGFEHDREALRGDFKVAIERVVGQPARSHDEIRKIKRKYADILKHKNRDLFESEDLAGLKGPSVYKVIRPGQDDVSREL